MNVVLFLLLLYKNFIVFTDDKYNFLLFALFIHTPFLHYVAVIVLPRCAINKATLLYSIL